MTALPTRAEMLRHALAGMEQASAALSDARDWLNADWRPVGSALTPAQTNARAHARRAITASQAEISAAADALRRAAGGAR